MSINIDGGTMRFSTSRELGLINSALGKNLERLSTGFRINSASDDAANLALSKSFDSHISDSRAFKRNSQNANNVLQILDGDMEKIQSDLQRVRTLAIQGMNGVYGPQELQAIRDEVKELSYGIEQIALSSSYSDKKLLDGTNADMQIQVASDAGVSTSLIDLTSVTDELDFVNVLTEKEQLYFLNMASGGTYYAEFDDRLYEITNNSTDPRELIYRYEEDLGNLDNSIEFIKNSQGVDASMYGEYENDHVQLGSGERVLNIAAGATSHVRVGNRVFDITNASGVDNTAVFETSGDTITMLSGDGISGSYQYATSSYTALSNGDMALDFGTGETKHIEYAGRLYELQNTSGDSQTLVFENSGGLSVVAGGANINVTNLGSMTNETIMTGTERHATLGALDTRYYINFGTIYRLQNNTASNQNTVLDSSNNLLNTTGAVSKTAMSTATNGDVSAMANPYAMQVQSGQTYYIKSSDNTTLHELTATQTGVALLDFDGDNIVGFDGVNLNHNVVTGTSFSDVAPDGLDQFSVNLSAGATESITIGSEVYDLDNSGNGAQVVTYQYDSVGKTLTDISAGTTTGTYIDSLDTPISIGANDVFVESLAAGATTYIEFGSDIFEIQNTSGSTRGFVFSHNAGAHTLTPSIPGGVTTNLMNEISFSGVDAGDIMLNMSGGQTQNITVGGNTFSVENAQGASQTVLLNNSGGNLTVDTGQNLNITKYNDMDSGSSLTSSNFYVDFNAGETKYIARGGEFFRVQNTTGDSKIAVFSQSGTNLNPIETSGVNDVYMGAESYEGTTTTSDYYVELEANETKWININDYAFELTNSTGARQTEVMRVSGGSVTNEYNSDVSQMNIPISNLDNFNQLLTKVDWAMEVVQNRRAEIGSKMNAFESIIDRNAIREQNLIATNSILRDADIAKESCEMAKNKILQQSASNVLSQLSGITSNLTLTLLSGI